MTLSDRIRHFFHVISDIRPIYWIILYIVLTPLFALVYWALPDGQFRIPDGSGTDFGSWLYYSIVTITTLGFGDYTPAHAWAQAITAVEVVVGLSVFGFFLNAVASLKSENDVASEIEKQRRLHEASEYRKLHKSTPGILHNLNQFLSFCYAVTTPKDERKAKEVDYDPDFKFNEMKDLFKPSGLPSDHTRLPAVEGLLKASARTSLSLDTLQNNTDLTLWPDLLEDCFAFVANYQMFSSADSLNGRTLKLVGELDEKGAKTTEQKISEEIATLPDEPPVLNEKDDLYDIIALYYFIKRNGELAMKIEAALTKAVQADSNHF